MYLDRLLILNQMEDYSIFSVLVLVQCFDMLAVSNFVCICQIGLFVDIIISSLALSSENGLHFCSVPSKKSDRIFNDCLKRHARSSYTYTRDNH